ncbi:MAG TPA: pantetheine-phosphate adenylyltransferase [Bacteroidota bacterium]|nr:pantetheine-phosphate adenylyltransferase [Bacteroidota bacterium]
MKIALYPGTFDPVTVGHLDVIQRSREIFDQVIVTVARNTTKRPLFTDAERVKMIRDAVKPFRNVTVESFNGLLVSFAKKKKATSIVRGLRAISDFEYEFQMALMNRKLDDSITTVFLMPHERYTYLNSSIVREIAMLGGDISEFVPPAVRRLLLKKIRSLKK